MEVATPLPPPYPWTLTEYPTTGNNPVRGGNSFPPPPRPPVGRGLINGIRIVVLLKIDKRLTKLNKLNNADSTREFRILLGSNYASILARMPANE